MRTVKITSVIAAVALAMVSLFAGTTHGHICLTYPMQRGPTPRLHPGDERCFNRVPSCGSLPKGNATARFQTGQLYTLSFQQNLNHWYEPKPGFFDVAVSYDNEATWLPLAAPISDFPANNMNTQTDFAVPVEFPLAAKSAIVRARYVSNNVDEVYPANNTDAIFYSCSDIEVTFANGSFPATSAAVSPAGMDDASAVHAKKIALDVPTSRRQRGGEAKKKSVGASWSRGACTTPDKWIAHGITRSRIGGIAMFHTIHYDTSSGWIRWNRNNTAIGGNYDMTDLWNLTMASGGYTPQFIIGVNGPNTCAMYGGDAFFPWSYGEKAGMKFTGEFTEGDRTEFWYAIESSDFTFASVVASNATESGVCLPYAMEHGMLRTEFYSEAVSDIPASVFAIPAECQPNLALGVPTAGCKGRRHGAPNHRH